MSAGFSLDINDFTLEEQDIITWTKRQIDQKQKDIDNEGWVKFFKTGFEAVCKQISKIRL